MRGIISSTRGKRIEGFQDFDFFGAPRSRDRGGGDLELNLSGRNFWISKIKLLFASRSIVLLIPHQPIQSRSRWLMHNTLPMNMAGHSSSLENSRRNLDCMVLKRTRYNFFLLIEHPINFSSIGPIVSHPCRKDRCQCDPNISWSTRYSFLFIIKKITV